MKFITVRDLRSQTAAIRKELDDEKEMVVTANGRPFAILTAVEPDRLEQELKAIRSAKAKAALDALRAEAKAQGLDSVSMAEIDEAIADVRRRRAGGKARR